MDHLTEVGKRRRLVTLRQKGMDTKLTLAAQEEKDLERQRAADAEEEFQLRKELEALTAEHHEVQLQLQMADDRVRHAEAEEPLLHVHATERLSALEAQAEGWKERLEALDALCDAWKRDPITSGIKASMDQLDEEITFLRQEFEKAEKELIHATTEVARLRALLSGESEAGSRKLSPSGPTDAGHRDLFTFKNVSQDYGVEGGASCCRVEEILQEIAQLERQQGAMQREVEDLTTRANELDRWYKDVLASRDNLAMKQQMLQRCLQEKMCAACLATIAASAQNA